MFHIWMNSTLFKVRIIHAQRQIFLNFIFIFFYIGPDKVFVYEQVAVQSRCSAARTQLCSKGFK